MLRRCALSGGRRLAAAAPRLRADSGGGSKRLGSSSSSSSSSGKKPPAAADQKDLKWTEREEAPKWLQKMAPTKGGTALPTPKEAAVIAVVAAAGYYAWFVEPPQRADEH